MPAEGTGRATRGLLASSRCSRSTSNFASSPWAPSTSSPTEELQRKLDGARPLRVKLGIDPTASDIHLGFAVVLRKLRQFQDLGHTAVLILGDFTAQVGDPTGKSATRPQLSNEEVEAHAETYIEQVRRILLPERLEVRRNSEWLAAMGIDGVLRLAARATVAEMLGRNDFAQRYEAGKADLAARAAVSAPAGLGLGDGRGRCGARRHRSAVQQPGRP